VKLLYRKIASLQFVQPVSNYYKLHNARGLLLQWQRQ